MVFFLLVLLVLLGPLAYFFGADSRPGYVERDRGWLRPRS
jgi:hypothetical protein